MNVELAVGRPNRSTEPEQNGNDLRILIVAHSHPELSKGGSEIAAQMLSRGIAERPGCAAWFMGCDRRERRSDTPITQPFDNEDYLYSTGEFDWFRFANRDPRFPEAFTELLTELAPDVVHFHHYINVGVEALLHVRRALPNTKIILTLHEYLAICNHHGQMVTKPHHNLCHEDGPKKCIGCFPELDESDFILRRRYIQHFFTMVDHFISPSAFLANRYVRWGVQASRISVIENVVRPVTSEPEPYVPAPNTTLRAGFFGQLSPLKGVNVLLEAARQLETLERFDIAFEIFGDYRGQPPDFQKELLEQLQKLGSNIRFRGPYDETRVDQLMQSVDVVIVPSVWWENSPLVIQEAFRNRRPVICSDIGGMAEKVRNGIDGFQFHVDSVADLATVLRRLADDRELLRTLTQTMRQPPRSGDVIDAHLDLYRALTAAGQDGAAPPAMDLAGPALASGGNPAKRLNARIRAATGYPDYLVLEAFLSPFVDEVLVTTRLGGSKSDPEVIRRYLDLPVASRPEVSFFFDRDYYWHLYPDIQAVELDPLVHFILWGVQENRSPHPLIDLRHIAASKPDILPDPPSIDALCDVLCHDLVDSSRHFDLDFYRTQLDGSAEVSGGLLRHFLDVGLLRRLRPNPRFDPIAYYQGSGEKSFDIRCALRQFALLGAAGQDAADMSPTGGQAGALSRLRAEAGQLYRRQHALAFDCNGPPDISVIVVAQGNIAPTLQTLASLRANHPGSVQLVLIDAGATGEVGHLRQYVSGADVLRFDSDIGFVPGCNAGLQMVQAETVLLLGNDVELAADALTNALRRLRSDSTIGAVGGKMLQVHGLLQEAGGIIWRDGWTVGYQHDQSPLCPEANFVRDVDVCSAAFLLTRVEVLRNLGGFDTSLAGTPFADADLCLRARDAGYRVVYDPSVVIHRLRADAVPSEADQSRMQAAHGVFLSKHGERLRHHYTADGRGQIFARSANRPRGRILMIEDQVPLRCLGSGFVRSNDIVATMVGMGYDVSIFPMRSASHGLTAIYGDFPDTVEIAHDRNLGHLESCLQLRRGYYDTIWVARTHNLDLVKPLLERCGSDILGGARLVLDTEAIAAAREAERRATQGDPEPFNLEQAIQREMGNAHLCQRIVAVCAAEADTLRTAGFDDVQVLGHSRAVAVTPRPWQQRSGLLFVGAIPSMDSPNYDSLCWFVDEVLPLIEQELGYDTRLTVAGSLGPGVSLRRFEDHARVILRGPVADLTPLYDSHRVFVAPTRFGAGLPYKVQEAASFGLPVVATELLRRQLGWQGGRDLLCAAATDPAGFARQVLTLYRSEAAWEDVRRAAVLRIEAECGRESYERSLAAILN